MTTASVTAPTNLSHRAARQHSRGRSLGQWLVLFCVLVAVSLYGVTSAVVTLLGSYHTHTSADAGEAAGMVLEDFRRIDHAYDTLGLTRPHMHAESHLSLQRHHHDSDDATVQSIDAGAEDPVGDGAAASAIGMLAMMLCGFGLLMLTAPLARSVRWTLIGCPAIPSGHAHLLERPPRT